MAGSHLRAKFLEKLYPGQPNRSLNGRFASPFKFCKFSRRFVRPMANPAAGKILAIEVAGL